MIEETENGILIHAIQNSKKKSTSFYEKLANARANRVEIKKRIREYVNDPEVQAMYKDPEINMDLHYTK